MVLSNQQQQEDDVSVIRNRLITSVAKVAEDANRLRQLEGAPPFDASSSLLAISDPASGTISVSMFPLELPNIENVPEGVPTAHQPPRRFSKRCWQLCFKECLDVLLLLPADIHHQRGKATKFSSSSVTFNA